MKSVCLWRAAAIAFCCIELVAAATPDPGAVMAQVSGVMAASNANLAKAERRHKKAMKKATKQVAKFLSFEAEALGEVLGTYARELGEASKELDRQVNASKVALAHDDEQLSNANDWRGSESHAMLEAKVNTAEQTLRRNVRHSANALRDAEERAESPLEDETETLARKIGDLAPLVDKAKADLEAHVVAATANATIGNSTDAVTLKLATPSALVGPAAPGQLTALAEALGNATKLSKANMAAASKRVNAALAEASQRATKNAGDIAAALVKEEHDEIEGIRSQSAMSLPKSLHTTKLRATARDSPQKFTKVQK